MQQACTTTGFLGFNQLAKEFVPLPGPFTPKADSTTISVIDPEFSPVREMQDLGSPAKPAVTAKEFTPSKVIKEFTPSKAVKEFTPSKVVKEFTPMVKEFTPSKAIKEFTPSKAATPSSAFTTINVAAPEFSPPTAASPSAAQGTPGFVQREIAKKEARRVDVVQEESAEIGAAYAVDDSDVNKQESAATLIQAIYRGNMARDRVDEMYDQTEAATRIQAAFRGQSVRRTFDTYKQIDAATTIQSVFRGSVVRAAIAKAGDEEEAKSEGNDSVDTFFDEAEAASAASKFVKDRKRRQSRGIFRIQERAVIPGVGEYDTFKSDFAKSPASNKTGAFGSTGSRFESRGSVYSATATAAPGVGYYGLTDDNANTPSKSKGIKFASGPSDRFSDKGSIYCNKSTPGVGSYGADDLKSKSPGVKMMRPKRDRKSRGIFAGLEKKSAAMPDSAQYSNVEVDGMAASVNSHMPSPAFFKGERFANKSGGIYTKGVDAAHESTFTPKGAFDSSRSNATSAKKNTPSKSRFDGPGSMYNKSTTPGVGQYEQKAAPTPRTASAGVIQGAFRKAADRRKSRGIFKHLPESGSLSYDITVQDKSSFNAKENKGAASFGSKTTRFGSSTSSGAPKTITGAAKPATPFALQN